MQCLAACPIYSQLQDTTDSRQLLHRQQKFSYVYRTHAHIIEFWLHLWKSCWRVQGPSWATNHGPRHTSILSEQWLHYWTVVQEMFMKTVH